MHLVIIRYHSCLYSNADARLCPDDEIYEREVISTNKVYKLQEGDPPHLIPVKDQCGYMPRIAILNTKEVRQQRVENI